MGGIIQKIVLSSELEKIWRFITEPKNFPKYVYGYSGGRVISSNRTGVGAIYEWYGKLGPFKLKSREEIVKWQEKKLVAYSGKMFWIKFDSSMRVREIKKLTQLTVFIEYKVPIYFGGVIMDTFLIRWIVKDYVNKSLIKLGRNMQ